MVCVSQVGLSVSGRRSIEQRLTRSSAHRIGDRLSLPGQHVCFVWQSVCLIATDTVYGCWPVKPVFTVTMHKECATADDQHAEYASSRVHKH